MSVVIPTLARPAALDACLTALAAQTIGTEQFDVVVVDDGGREPLDGVLERHRSSLRMTVHRQARSGPAAARNAGAALAQGALLAFTDDDCMPGAGWLQALVRVLRRRPDSLVGGRTVNALEANLYAEASQALLRYLHADAQRHGGYRFFASNNLAMRRVAFDEVGGFSTSFPGAAAEDRDLCDRWKAQGRPLHYEEQALVRHAHAMGMHSFVRQHVEYGRGARRLQDARARRGQPRLRVGLPVFYARMLRFPFGHMPARRALPVASLVALSQTATALGFLHESRRGGR